MPVPILAFQSCYSSTAFFLLLVRIYIRILRFHINLSLFRERNRYLYIYVYMDGRGGCCIARYAGGACDKSKVDLIMLRFRPIAPKPATGGSVSGAGSSVSTLENSEACGRSGGGRGKRRYVRDGGSSNKRSYSKKRKCSPEATRSCSGGSVSGGEAIVTLPLLPETPDRKDSPARCGCHSDQSDSSVTGKPVDKTTVGKKVTQNSPILLSFGDGGALNDEDAGMDPAVVMTPQPVRYVGSCVTVECVTDAWADYSGGLGLTEEEKVMMNLENDACPGFVTDGQNRVKWANRAYRKMLGQDGNDDDYDNGEVVIWLALKEKVVLPVTCPAFSCRVKVTWPRNDKTLLLTLPCDVWRTRSGGFAWRLDVKAALCLGR